MNESCYVEDYALISDYFSFVTGFQTSALYWPQNGSMSLALVAGRCQFGSGGFVVGSTITSPLL